jgi:phenylalanyl-tRNA synthetase alpha chain
METRRAEIALAEREDRLRAEAVDVTLPWRLGTTGTPAPSQRVIDDVVDFFVGLDTA